MSNRIQREQLARAIISQVARVTPYTTSDSHSEALAYSTGLLASYIAHLSNEDPWVYKRYLQYIERLSQHPDLTKKQKRK